MITDSAGNIKSDSDYYPWGGELEFIANDSNHYKFTGKERDSETALDYFGARYYSNGLGRFVTPDWAAKATAVPYADFADPQSLNLYGYVRGLPTTRNDADGHCYPFCDIAVKIAGWFGSAAARDGGVKPAAKNTGIGLAKGGGQFGLALGAGLANMATTGNPLAGAGNNLLLTKTGMQAATAVTPSNQTQAEAAPVGVAIASTVVTAGLTYGAGALTGAASAAEESTTFFHYGYMADEANFAGGLRAGAFATTDGGLTGAEAQSTLALPNRITGVPDAVYPVTPEPGTPMTGPSTVQPANGYPGGGQEVSFPQGTGPGTVAPPKPIPPQ